MLVLAAAAMLYASNRPDTGYPHVGSELPDFALSDLHGDIVRLQDYRGKTVLINAWATWCPPCRAEMPMLVTEYQARRHSGFVVLAINAGENRADAQAFAVEYGMVFPCSRSVSGAR